MSTDKDLEKCTRLYVYSDGFYADEQLEGLEPVFELIVCRNYIGLGDGGLVSPASDEELRIDREALKGCVAAIRAWVGERAGNLRGAGGQLGLPVSLSTKDVGELLYHVVPRGCRKLGVEGLLLALTIALAPHVLSRDKLLVDTLLEGLGGDND